MRILHICAGWQQWNGAANIARMIMGEQERAGHEVASRTWASIRELRAADEVWIHCSWLPCLWWAALWGKKFRWMPECSYDPVRLRYHGWKKWLVGPIERYFLRRADRIVATCAAEKGWIEAYLGKRCPVIEVTDIKRFFNFSRVERVERVEGDGKDSHVEQVEHVEGEGKDSRVERVERVEGVEKNSHVEHVDHVGGAGRLHLLYLGRRHPLKGLEYLEKAVKSLEFRVQSLDLGESKTGRVERVERRVELRVVSNAFGEEKERVWEWCDVLVLPTLSENFGLVVAEALERGKRVITTDGAPAWGGDSLEFRVLSSEFRVSSVGEGKNSHVERVDRVEGVPSLEFRVQSLEFGGEIWSGYGGRLLYLVGYREGSEDERVRLLKEAIERVV